MKRRLKTKQDVLILIENTNNQFESESFVTSKIQSET